MKNKNITMVQEIEPNLLVLADYHKIEQVVSNYLRNALNHVTQNGVIKISATSIANKVRISVFNEGPSIPEESLEKIWTSFYKVDKARTRDYGGTGLGLSVVKSILTAHHNLCGVENMQNGVSFWFDLDKAEEMTK